MRSFAIKLAPLAIAAVAASLFVALVVATEARAERAVYPPKPIRDVASADLFSESSSVRGLCLPGLTCPMVTNTWQSGQRRSGQPGSFLRTEISGLTGVGNRVSGTWESDKFRYDGIDGRRPDKLTLEVARRSDTQTLLQAAGNDAVMTLAVLTANGNAAFEFKVRLTPEEDWRVVGPKRLDPATMKPGRSYAIKITSTFISGAQVVPDASADYDHIRLVAKNKRRR